MQKNNVKKSLLLAVYFFTFSMLFIQVSASQGQDINSFKTFADWCDNKDSLRKEMRHTVEQLLVEAKTPNCRLANEELSNKILTIYLDKKGISSLHPLKSLPNIIRIDLSGNQINDLAPLQSLTNLEYLYLRDNQITALSPLGYLTKLKVLTL
ncbi:MAG: leucine-rich repeat domain-containing protein, partial [Pseudanabaena sp.]